MPPRAATPRATTPRATRPRATTPRARKRPAPAPGSIGPTAPEVAAEAPPPALGPTCARIHAAGGAVLACYREPFAGQWVVFAALPLDRVEPTPYQRELSDAHAARLATVIPKVGRFLDPVVAVARGEGFITPNGMHRLAAMRSLGARAITALVVPEEEVAFRILALNTEKAHNLKDRALEVIRMARALAADPATAGRTEAELALEFEQGALLTLGLCYERQPRFAGAAYLPVVSRCDELRAAPLADTLPARAPLADALLALDAAVVDAVGRLERAGYTRGYLKPLVVSRINPLRWMPAPRGRKAAEAPPPDLARTLEQMVAAARAFDPSSLKPADVAAAAWMGGAEE